MVTYSSTKIVCDELNMHGVKCGMDVNISPAPVCCPQGLLNEPDLPLCASRYPHLSTVKRRLPDPLATKQLSMSFKQYLGGSRKSPNIWLYWTLP